MSLLVLAGATASGKSELALRFARLRRARGEETEIISADSIAVYRGLEIGAAKPSREERAEFRHHLIDVADPSEEFSAADFVRLATQAIDEIRARQACPLIVGGTGFYLRALLRGMASGSSESNEELRRWKRHFEERAAREGFGVLHRELLRLDPEASATVHPNDHYRIVRALQAMAIDGRPWSGRNRTARATPFRFPGTRYLCLRVEAPELRRRVELRTREMLARGLLGEVRGLLENGLPPGARPLGSVGYKECVDSLAGREPPGTLQERITRSTLRLTKRQLTWFRGEQGVVWVSPEQALAQMEASASAATQ